jgi:hypothetical protein
VKREQQNGGNDTKSPPSSEFGFFIADQVHSLPQNPG